MEYIIAGIAIVVVIIVVIFKSKKEEINDGVAKITDDEFDVDYDRNLFNDKKVVMVVGDVVEDDSFYSLGVIADYSVKDGDVVSIANSLGQIIDGNVVVHDVSKEVVVDGKPDIEFNTEAYPGDVVSVGVYTHIELKKGMVIIKN